MERPPAANLDPDPILRRYPAQFRPIGPRDDLGGGGGLSGSRLWRFESGRGRLLLRAWPCPGPTRPQLERVHRWIAAAADLDLLPIPIPDNDGRTLLDGAGRLWELVPWLEGEPDSLDDPCPRRVALAFRALASLHRRWEAETTLGPSPDLADRLQELDALTARGFATLGDRVRAAGDDGLAPLASRWLREAPRVAGAIRERLALGSRAAVRRQPCIRDARPEHFLFVGDRLNGVVDFGAMGPDSVAADLARLGRLWLAGRPRLLHDALDAYEEIRPLDPAERRLITVFEDSAALLAGAHWLRWHYLEGRTFDGPDAVRSGIDRASRELDRLLRERDPA